MDIASSPPPRKDGWFHRPIEQRNIPHRGLEILNAPGRRRVRQVELDRRTIDGPGLGDRDKSFDILQVHEFRA
jgi:hypothetical protein